LLGKHQTSLQNQTLEVHQTGQVCWEYLAFQALITHHADLPQQKKHTTNRVSTSNANGFNNLSFNGLWQKQSL